MMKLIRWFLSKIILFLDSAFSPKSVQRDAAEQARIDQAMQGLILYQFEGCPFCVKVRRAAKRMGIKLELRDANKVPAYGQELVQGGGSMQVPCLRISNADGSVRWLYESSDIIEFLEKRIAAGL
jgi:glutaredoxin